MAEKYCARIKEVVGTNFFAITTDSWSQPTKTPSLQRLNYVKSKFINYHLSITIHCTDENFCRHDLVLGAIPTDFVTHSAENLAIKIEQSSLN